MSFDIKMASDDSDSDVDKILIFAYFHTHRRTLRQQRAIWIHDKIRKRWQLGEYHHLVSELRRDSFRFKMYFRMSPTVFKSHLKSAVMQTMFDGTVLSCGNYISNVLQ